MGWFRLAGTFSDHPKVIAAGNAAVGLYVRLGCWSAEHETDGFVPEEVARRFGSRRELSRLLQSARPGSRPMLDVMDGGYLLRDFLAFNPSHEAQTARRELNAKRQERWRVSNASPNASSNGVSNGASSPLHSVPTVVSSLQSGDAPAREVPRMAETVDDLAREALEIVASVLARGNAAPERAMAYRRAVMDHADDHLPELSRIARETHAISAQFVANSYLGLATDSRRSHASCARCLGRGVVYADEDDPDRGVIPCPG